MDILPFFLPATVVVLFTLLSTRARGGRHSRSVGRFRRTVRRRSWRVGWR